MRREKRFSARVLAAYEAGPKGALAIRAAKADQPAEILLYDEIGYWGVTAGAFQQALLQAGDGPVRVRINSPGGDVFDGLAIFNALAAHKGGVETVVDGLAASMASVIALAGPMTMQDSSMFMIHNAWTFMAGNRHDLTKQAGVLGKIDGQIAAIYGAKTGLSAEEIAAAMDAETWLTAAEAKTAGYADTVLPPPEPVQAPAEASATPPAPPEPEPVPNRRAMQARARLRMLEAESQ